MSHYVLRGVTVKARVSGTKLHEYLLQYLVADVSTPFDQPTEITTLLDAQQHLKRGYEHLRQQNSASLRASIDYGYWLNIVYEIYERAKITGKVKGTWARWLATNVGIKDSYARKLRVVAMLLDGYPRFKRLSMIFAEVYTRRKEIGEMLQQPDIATYWRPP